MKAVRYPIVWLFLVLGLLGAAQAQAALCSDVYSDTSGINANLQSSGDTLDLSGVPWANNSWPASGSTLAPGDYYYGGANLGNGYTLNVGSGGPVRIFVSGSLAFGNNAALNVNGAAGEFLLVVDGDLSLGNSTVINGLVYATGSITVGNNAQISGGLAAGGGISVGQNSLIQTNYSGVDQGLLAGFCQMPVDLSANGDSAGPVTVTVGETVTLSVTAEGCPAPAWWATHQQWADQWTIDGDVSTDISNTSLCDRSPVSRSVTFDQVGEYLVGVESFFRDCWNFFCTAQQSYGADEITIVVVESSLACFADQFSDGSLSPDDWVTTVASGGFTPSVVNGRLRMTEAVSNQSTAATLQQEIPGADNLVVFEFDYYAYGGDGADGLAVVFSDATITPQPGSFGGSLGYAQRDNGDPGFAGGWLGIGLDEYGNFSNPTEGRVGGPGFRPDAVAIRGAYQGGYAYLRGTNSLSPGIDQPGNAPTPHRYRIIVNSQVDGQAMVSVERDTTGTGNSFQQLVMPFNALDELGQSAVPENFLLSLTGSTGGSTNIHELDNIQLCALQLNPVGEQVDHFEIVLDGVALTCQPEIVTLRACANASCDTLFTDPVEATLAPTSGWQGGNVVTISGGTGQATLQHTTPGEVTLDVIGSQPSTQPQAVTLCQVGAGTLSAENCTLEFFSSGLAFDVPNLTSHRPSGPIEIRAVRQDDDTQACVPAFENVQKSVQFWSTYLDPGPNGRPASRPVSVNGTDVSGDQSAPSVLGLDFGPGGIAEVEVMYPDAGQMQLDAWYVGSEATDDDGLVMPGADSFISVPAGLCVSAAGECATGDASCPTFVRAGEEFALSITAVGWEVDGDSNLCQGNPVTPNFRLLNIPLASTVVSPSSKENGVLEPGDYSHTRSVDATEVVTAHISEVGVFQFTATPDDGDYLGLTAPSGTSAPIGRFYPDTFNVTVDPGELEAECAAGTPFTYTGQDFGWLIAPSLLIEPLSVQGSRTLNYTETGFQRLTADDVARIFPVADSTTVNTGGDPMAVTTTEAGGSLSVINPGQLQYEFSSVGDAFRYDKVAEARVAPFNPNLAFTITDVVDSDGVSANAAPYDDITPVANFDIRYGRLAMENVYGPENVSELQMPFRLEYWNGTRFVLNTADDCTAWTTGDITGTTGHHSLAPNSGVFIGGEDGPLSLQPNNIAGTDVLIWGVEDWLKNDTDEDGTLDDPSALATFGVYRGHDRVIYWREQ